MANEKVEQKAEQKTAKPPTERERLQQQYDLLKADGVSVSVLLGWIMDRAAEQGASYGYFVYWLRR